MGGAFAQQYYLILRTSPDEVYKFYHGNSRVSRPSASGRGGMDNVTTLELVLAPRPAGRRRLLRARGHVDLR